MKRMKLCLAAGLCAAAFLLSGCDGLSLGDEDERLVPAHDKSSIVAFVDLTTGSAPFGCSVVGSGTFGADGFTNVGAASRTNYLLLPTDLMSHSADTKEMSVAIKVKGSSGYDALYCPLFACYAAAPADGENTFPMFIIQSRGLCQVNCSGYCDFGGDYNDADSNAESVSYLANDDWHVVAFTATEKNVVIYVDGVVANSWTIDGTDGQNISGLFSAGSSLVYNCLGGNQAWAWEDKDMAATFAWVKVYDKALTADEVKALEE